MSRRTVCSPFSYSRHNPLAPTTCLDIHWDIDRSKWVEQAESCIANNIHGASVASSQRLRAVARRVLQASEEMIYVHKERKEQSFQSCNFTKQQTWIQEVIIIMWNKTIMYNHRLPHCLHFHCSLPRWPVWGPHLLWLIHCSVYPHLNHPSPDILAQASFCLIRHVGSP